MDKNRIKKRKKKVSPQSFSLSIKEYLLGRKFKKGSANKIAQVLQLGDEHLTDINDIGKDLVKQHLLKVSDGIFEKCEEKTLEASLSLHHKGFGFATLVAKHPTITEDVFIPRAHVSNALDGDIIEIIITNETSPKGPEGRVVTVTKRKAQFAVAVVIKNEKNVTYAHVPSMPSMKRAEVELQKNHDTSIGSAYKCQILKWHSSSSAPLLKANEYLGNVDDAFNDEKIFSLEHNIDESFSDESLKEASSFGTRITKSSRTGRKEIVDLETFTIDPKTAKDFDDAISIQKKKSGFILHVHIADVSHYIQKGSILDKEAAAKGNSTYFPGHCFSMIPKTLSDNLCSLKPKVQRLAVTVEMHFSEDATLESSRWYKSIICSDTRFSYEDAKLVLEGKKKSKHKESLLLLNDLCLLLQKKRRDRGSVELHLPEYSIVIDEKGSPTHMETVEYDITHQMIEECMVKTNEVIGMYIDSTYGKGIFRIHEPPEIEVMKDFFAIARSVDSSFPKEPTDSDIVAFFTKQNKLPSAEMLSVAYIRSMKLATYSEFNAGHFGLGLTAYTHFTSPIRRYSDLVAHRLIFDDLPSDFEAISDHCSQKERQSFKAEIAIKLMKKLRLINLNKDTLLDATVRKVTPFFIICDISRYQLEAKIHVSEIPNDYFEYDGENSILKGRRTGQIITKDTKVSLKCTKVDFTYREATYNIKQIY